MRILAYIRVSSKDQNVNRQLEEMKALGIEERDVFIDHESGKDFLREQYQIMKRVLSEGDLLYPQFPMIYNEAGGLIPRFL